MIVLNSNEVSSVKSAVEYMDQGVIKTAYEKIDNLNSNEDVLILNKSEIQKILTFIYEQDCAIHNGAIQPPSLSFLSTLEDFVK